MKGNKGKKNLKTSSHCVSGRHCSGIVKLYADLPKAGRKLLHAKCFRGFAFESMAENDNKIKFGRLGPNICHIVSKISHKYNRSPGRALKVGQKLVAQMMSSQNVKQIFLSSPLFKILHQAC